MLRIDRAVPVSALDELERRPFTHLYGVSGVSRPTLSHHQ